MKMLRALHWYDSSLRNPTALMPELPSWIATTPGTSPQNPPSNAHLRAQTIYEPMKRLYEEEPDFEALIRIYSPRQGGREHPPCNGIRWKFAYADDPAGETLYAIWPDFLDEKGDSLPEDVPLPIDVELPARMTVAVKGTRALIHRARITEGLRFYCHEQSRRVAEGRVTRVTGLLRDDDPDI